MKESMTVIKKNVFILNQNKDNFVNNPKDNWIFKVCLKSIKKKKSTCIWLEQFELE